MPRKPEPIAVEVPEGCKSSETGKTHRLFIEGGGAGRGREERCQDLNESTSQYEMKWKR